MRSSQKINRDTSRSLAVIGVRLLDDAYMTWVAAELEAGRALQAWFAAPAAQGAGTYVAYQAAADREEAAADDLQRLSELTQPYQEQLALSE